MCSGVRLHDSPRDPFGDRTAGTAAPWEAGTRDIFWSAHAGAWAAKNCPSPGEQTCNLLLNAAKGVLATNRGKRMVDALAVKAIAAVGKEVPGPEAPEAVALRRERLIRIFLEPFRQYVLVQGGDAFMSVGIPS